MSSGLVKVADSCLLPGMPGIRVRPDSRTSQVTWTVTWAGAPGGMANPAVPTVTCGVQSRWSAARTDCADARASAWAWAGVRAMLAWRAASRAASAIALRAMMTRPAVTARARNMIRTRATGASSTAALPASRSPVTAMSWW